ncbi:hypothetical protein ACOMCU_01670 [Lysinibacillus sp. UGB7]|uniref:hypothetical protein n=1 Tax=Lysinibacillus sp. UGB7 TaxID=3411039 RepID=UPI003B76E019
MKEVVLVSRIDNREVECVCTKCGSKSKRAVSMKGLATYRVNGQVSNFVGSEAGSIACSGCGNKNVSLVPTEDDITTIDVKSNEDVIEVNMYSEGISIVDTNKCEAIAVQQLINVGLLNVDLMPKKELVMTVVVCKYTSEIMVLADHSTHSLGNKQVASLTELPAYHTSFTCFVTPNVAIERFLYNVPVDVKMMIAEHLASKLDPEVAKKFNLLDFSWMKENSLDSYKHNETISSLYLLVNFPIFQQLNRVVKISSMHVADSDLERLRQATSLLEFAHIFVPALAESDLERFLQLRFVANGETNAYFDNISSIALGVLEEPEQVSIMLDYILAENTQVSLATVNGATNNNAESIRRSLNQVFDSETAYWDSFSSLFESYEKNIEHKNVVSKQELVKTRFKKLLSIATSLRLSRKRANELSYLVGNFEEMDVYKRLKAAVNGELKKMPVGEISAALDQINHKLSKEYYNFDVYEDESVYMVTAVLLKSKTEQPTDMILTINKETKELTCAIKGAKEVFDLAKVFVKTQSIHYYEANIYRTVFANLPMSILEKIHDILLDGLYADVIAKFNVGEAPDYGPKFARRFELLAVLHQLPMFAMFDGQANFYDFKFTEEDYEAFKAATSELEAMKVFIPNVTKKSMNVLKKTIATANRNGAERLSSIDMAYFGLLEDGNTIFNLAKFIHDDEQFINPTTEIVGYATERDIWKIDVEQAKALLEEYLLPGSLDQYINHVLSDKSFLASCQFEKGISEEVAEQKLHEKRAEAIRDFHLIVLDSVRMVQKFKNSLQKFEERLGKGIQVSPFLMENYEAAKELLAMRGTFKSIKKLHDALIEVSWNLKFETHVYEYKDYRLKLEGEHNGFEFYLPRNTEELVKAARQLKICIAGYEDKLLFGNHVYVLVRKNGIDVFCIEVDQYNAFVECKKRRNKLLSLENKADGPLIEAVQKFVTHHKIFIFNPDLDQAGIIGNQDEIPEEMYY